MCLFGRSLLSDSNSGWLSNWKQWQHKRGHIFTGLYSSIFCIWSSSSRYTTCSQKIVNWKRTGWSILNFFYPKINWWISNLIYRILFSSFRCLTFGVLFFAPFGPSILKPNLKFFVLFFLVPNIPYLHYGCAFSWPISLVQSHPGINEFRLVLSGSFVN